MPFTVFFRRSLLLRLIAVYGAILLLGFLLSGVFAFSRMGTLVERTIDSYGNTVASQLSQSTLDAVMQGDAIALQAHLGRLLKTPGIVSAAIYDMDTRLLAQAGATPTELAGRRHLHNYTATLAFGDNAMGTVVVTLDTGEIESLLPATRQLLAGAFVVMVLLLVLASRHFAHEVRDQRAAVARAVLDSVPSAALPPEPLPSSTHLDEDQVRALLNRLREYVEQVQSPSPAALRQAAAELLNAGGGRACLLLECRNLDLLQRQVSRERLRLLLDSMQAQVEKTCHLYNAQRVPVAGSCIKMVIAAAPGQIADALLQVACLAQVLAGVLAHCRDEELGIQLQWSMALDWHAPCENDFLRNRQHAQDDQRSLWLCRQVGAGELAVSAEAGALLQEQDVLTLGLDHGEDGRPFYRINGVIHTKRTLLDSQVSQLLDA